MNAHPIHVAILAFVLSAFEACHLSPATADAWTSQEVALARLTVSEAGFVEHEVAAVDHAMIAAIIKRRALRARRTITAQIARDHHTHTAGTGGRPWLAGLSASMERPAGWPEAHVRWNPTGVRQWSRTLEAARANLDDAAIDPCNGRADTWLARERPTMGEAMRRRIRERRERLLAAGHTPVDCGNTVNEPWHFGGGNDDDR